MVVLKKLAFSAFSFVLSLELTVDYLTFIWQRIKAAVHAFREQPTLLINGVGCRELGTLSYLLY